MSPMLIYPTSATQARNIKQNAEFNGAKVVKFTKHQLELIDDILFGKSIEEALKTPLVSEEQIFKTLHECK